MKILLATDGSAYSEGAAMFLSRFSLSQDDEILVLNVISHVPFKDNRELYYAKLKQIKQEIAPRILDSTIDILKPLNVKISTALLDGYPDKAIVDAASESGADLVVMGARGLKGIKSLLIGSITRSVSINSRTPVMVVKPPQWETAGTLKVLYATDGSSSAVNAERLLASIPFPKDAEITIVNVIPSAHIDIPERYWMEVDEKIKNEIAKIREAEFGVSDKIIEDARKILSSRFSKIKVSIKFGDPSLEILNEAEQSKTDLIAIGSSGMRGVKGMLGSVSRSILGHAECSVLIGK
ncbi:MAG: universal stress protein [Thermodesulfovibrionales bacterium]|jgi:nucleotide-binding universal stress UspA family protein|nr:universal stress protein [Thermodesulfovibrionales bacterium]